MCVLQWVGRYLRSQISHSTTPKAYTSVGGATSVEGSAVHLTSGPRISGAIHRSDPATVVNAALSTVRFVRVDPIVPPPVENDVSPTFAPPSLEPLPPTLPPADADAAPPLPLLCVLVLSTVLPRAPTPRSVGDSALLDVESITDRDVVDFDILPVPKSATSIEFIFFLKVWNERESRCSNVKNTIVWRELNRINADCLLVHLLVAYVHNTCGLQSEQLVRRQQWWAVSRASNWCADRSGKQSPTGAQAAVEGQDSP